jgi:hypothetical protein
MSFEAKRLRVQIPCRGDSVVELGARTAIPVTETIFCRVPSIPRCPLDSHVPECIARFGSRWPDDPTIRLGTPELCRNDTEPPCGHTPVSDWCGDPWDRIEIDPDPTDESGILLKREDLPRYRSQLERELRRIDSLKERREIIAGTLDELDAVEEKLQRGAQEK